MPTAKALGVDAKLQILPDGTVSVIGRDWVLAHELNDMKAGASSALPLQTAPKSVTMFFAIDDSGGGGSEVTGTGALGGAESPAIFPPNELPPAVITWPALATCHAIALPLTVVPDI